MKQQNQQNQSLCAPLGSTSINILIISVTSIRYSRLHEEMKKRAINYCLRVIDR